MKLYTFKSLWIIGGECLCKCPTAKHIWEKQINISLAPIFKCLLDISNNVPPLQYSNNIKYSVSPFLCSISLDDTFCTILLWYDKCW